MAKRTIAIGADHGGLVLKEFLKSRLAAMGCGVVDMGPYRCDPADDYPDFAFKVARYVAEHRKAFGVLICRTGTGVMMAANRFRAVRAALLYSGDSARLAREHEDANVAVLASDSFGARRNLAFLKAFLETGFAGEARHRRRIRKISQGRFA